MFWILDIVLSRWLLINLYSDLMLCIASEIFRILVYTELCLFKYMQGYSSIFSIVKAYIEASLRHIQVYSAAWATLPYSQASHILSSSMFRNGGMFKTLWNFEHIYSEPCHSQNSFHRYYSQPYAIFRQIQCVTLAYVKAWHNQNPGIFRTFP